jgi:hypothetical protein
MLHNHPKNLNERKRICHFEYFSKELNSRAAVESHSAYQKKHNPDKVLRLQRRLFMSAIGCSVVTGSVLGGVIGGGLGLAASPSICLIEAVLVGSMDYFVNGHGRSNTDSAAKFFDSCWIDVSVGVAVAGGILGGSIGLIYGVAKNIFNRF